MKQKITPPYPCLKQGNAGGIVLFIAPNTGTRLTQSTQPTPEDTETLSYKHPIGYMSNKWDESLFKPYNKPVTLQN